MLYNVTLTPLMPEFPSSGVSSFCHRSDEVMELVRKLLPLARGQKIVVEAELPDDDS